MDIEQIRNHCLHKELVSEETPFGPNTLVYKVSGKIFLLLALDEVPLRINVKCDPEEAIQLRDSYLAIIPGYHMNKKHWNTIILDGSVPHTLIMNSIDNSYQLVCGKSSKKQ
jgi:predicted DNA-binding protein (MmcQ/YjbR family)